MSATVLAPTPALSPVTGESTWEKMFGTFKMGKEDVPKESSDVLSPTMPVQRTRMASTSTAVEQNSNLYNRKPSAVSIIMGKDTRSGSESFPSKNRSFSISSRRSSKNSLRSWFKSANPDTDADVPAVPAIDRKFSMFSSHNPDVEVDGASPTVSPTTSRRPSYVPRSAASSFLRTTTPLSTDEKAEVFRRASVAASVADQPLPASRISTRAKSVASPRANKPAALHFTTPALSDLHIMKGVCEIDDSATPISPRGETFSHDSAPHSPADTTTEEPNSEAQIDSAKASPELNPVKNETTVSVAALTC